jgi:hypothetical protein
MWLRRGGPLLGVLAVLGACGALADEPAKRPLRLIGEAPASKSPALRRFVIDAAVTPGEDFQATIEGWFAGLGDESTPNGTAEGSCVERHCTLSVDIEGGKFSLVGEFMEVSAPLQARFTFKDEEGKLAAQGPVTLRPLSGPTADLPALAAPDAVDGAELDDLLMWNGLSLGFGTHDKGEPPSTFQRGTLADWQTIHQKPGTGLIFEADLAELRAGAVAARKAADWRPLGDAAHGWTAGYPAAVLTKAGGTGAERRFASADDAAELIIAIDPPMSREDFDAFVEKTTEDREGRSSVGYTRVNSDMEINYQQGGRAIYQAYHNREGGLARLSYSYPVDKEDPYGVYASILQRSLTVTDGLKR